jgi:hypothetical protein
MNPSSRCIGREGDRTFFRFPRSATPAVLPAREGQDKLSRRARRGEGRREFGSNLLKIVLGSDVE